MAYAKFCFVLLFFWLTTLPLAQSKQLFVDFQNGNDDNSGFSRESAWKHSPGDPNSGSNSLSYQLTPGDIIIFRGGVDYYGNILVPGSGDKNNPITFAGNRWGAQAARINGAKKVMVRFQQCSSQSDCYENPNWKNLLKSSLDLSFDPLAPVFVDQQRIWLASDPNQPDPFWFDNTKYYSVLDPKDSDTELTSRYLKLGDDLSPKNVASWGDALIAVWMKPNWVVMSKVESLDQLSGTVYFKRIKNKPYLDRESYYSFFNRPIDIDIPGEYIVDSQSKTMLLWPPEKTLINDSFIEVSSLSSGIDLNGKSNIVIDGFHISKYFGGIHGWQQGTAIINAKPNSSNLTIRNNLIDNLRSVEGVGAIELINVRNALVENNNIQNSQKSSGIRFDDSNNIVIRNNIISKIGRTGIRLIRNENVQILNNTLFNILGVHGNGISIYLKNKNIIVANNVIGNTPSAFTYHGTGNPSEAKGLWILNNLFLGRVNNWGNKFSSVFFLHNIIFAPNERSKALQIPEGEPDNVIINNIIDGFGVKIFPNDWILSNNIYTSLSWMQSPRYNWEFETEGHLDKSLAEGIQSIFKNGKNIQTPEGAMIYEYLPVSEFPSLSFDQWANPQPIGIIKNAIGAKRQQVH